MEGTKTQDCSTNEDDSTSLTACIILKYPLAATLSRTLINWRYVDSPQNSL
jgi:hypothetical protein